MSKLVIGKILEAIHFIIKQNGFEITEKQMSKADSEIIPYLLENLELEKSSVNVQHIGHPELSTDKRIYPAVMKYFSIVQDNASLYDELLEEGYEFIERYTSFKFYSLDRSFTSKFKKNEFKKLILKNDEAIRAFYNSLRGLDKGEKEYYYKEFSNIIHKDASVLRVGYNSRGYSSYNYLTQRNIEYFGSEYLVNAKENARNVINSIHCKIDEEKVEYIKELLDKYPDYKNIISLDSKVINSFTIDELSKMSYKDSKLYQAALKYDLASRVKEILKVNPAFDCPENFIRIEIFKVLSNEEILELSPMAIDKISKIKIKEIDNVIVMPVKEINKVVMLDKAKKKVDNITSRFKK